MQFLQTMRGQESWVRRIEHWVLRLVSLGFSLASAHAIRWFFSPLDGIDTLQPAITWVIAIGFGVLGYFVSRGLAHRMMNKEPMWSYVPICTIVEVVEIFCNYALAAAVIQRATWLTSAPYAQRTLLTSLTYAVLSIIPMVSLLLAVVDMDLERKKALQGTTARPATGKPVAAVPTFGAKNAAQPKPSGPMNTLGLPLSPGSPAPYAQGMAAQTGAAARPTVGMPQAANGSNGKNGLPLPVAASGGMGGMAAAPLAGIRPASSSTP